MHQRLISFLRRPLWEKYNSLGWTLAKLKTQFLYRHAFHKIGKGTIVRAPILLQNTQHVDLGENIIIWHGARLEVVTERSGHVFHPKVRIGNGVSIQQNFHLACAEEIIIGEKVAITENVGIFDIWHPYEDITSPIVEQPLRTAPVHIGNETFIGMGAIIQPGVSIGKHCSIGANSVVTRSIPDYSVAVGVPARIIKKYDSTRKQWILL